MVKGYAQGSEIEVPVFYEDDKVRITPNGRGVDEWDVLVKKDEQYFLLQRSVPEHFIGTPPEQLPDQLDNYDSRIMYALKGSSISVQKFSWILSQAKIKSLEGKISDLIKDLSERRD